MWHVYILKCSDGSLYTGTTTDIPRRIIEHNNKKGGSYTRSRLPVALLHKENCLTRSQALKREIQVKGLSRAEKLSLVENGATRVQARGSLAEYKVLSEAKGIVKLVRNTEDAD